MGRRTRPTLPNGVSTDYQYDAASRLVRLAYGTAAGALGDLTYDYDPVGRRVGVGGALARTRLPDPVPAASYDARPRRGRRPARRASFTYDALDRRIQKTVSGVTTAFVYDRLDVAQELVEGISTSYLRGLQLDEPFSRGMDEVFLTDALGSVITLTSAAGAAATEYTYEPFGRVETGVASTNPFQFTGRENDGTGLYYYRARYYHPELQRFIAEDPIGLQGGINFYRYVHNNPLRWTDPLGLKVYRCCRDVEVNPAINAAASAFGLKHCFIKTDTREAGMGPAVGGSEPASPVGTPTQVTDHTGQSARSRCTEVPEVDESCVNKQLEIGRPTGAWGPTNNCNTFVDRTIFSCRKQW